MVRNRPYEFDYPSNRLVAPFAISAHRELTVRGQEPPDWGAGPVALESTYGLTASPEPGELHHIRERYN